MYSLTYLASPKLRDRCAEPQWSRAGCKLHRSDAETAGRARSCPGSFPTARNGAGRCPGPLGPGLRPGRAVRGTESLTYGSRSYHSTEHKFDVSSIIWPMAYWPRRYLCSLIQVALLLPGGVQVHHLLPRSDKSGILRSFLARLVLCRQRAASSPHARRAWHRRLTAMTTDGLWSGWFAGGRIPASAHHDPKG
jgi:hypothetical protein